MKIIYACTVLNNESFEIVRKNISFLKKIDIEFIVILNTNKKINKEMGNVKIIKKVGDLKYSREELCKELSKYHADAYLVFDSDIDFSNIKREDFKKIISFNKRYDFISLYYKNDPPIPAFFTLASSLTDYYNESKKHFGLEEQFFDDSYFNISKYQIPNNIKSNKELKSIIFGKSYSRDIKKFTDDIDENDTTTGGATIYFKKEILNCFFSWPSHNEKSLIWYDSYRTFMLSKKYRYAKVPIFVDHFRHNKTINLNWNSVESYILGFNFYMSEKNKNWNNDSLIIHTIELFFYIKGILEKIKEINLNKGDNIVIKEINDYMNIDIFNLIERIKKWK